MLSFRDKPLGTAVALLASVAMPSVVAAQDADSASRQTIVVTAPGAGIDLDDAITLDRQAVWRDGGPDLLPALGRQAGITLQDAQNNPWQPNLVYRGFAASPLQGQAQGLAVYLDGARFNQPFGDTVSFDLIPDAALRSVALLDASPVYGLNALGGALVLESANGHSDPGLDASAALGAYGQREAAVSGGGAMGAFSYFVAGQYRRETGWRDHSPSELGNVYADIGWDGAQAGVHAKFIGADTDLTGNGVAPVELLAARRQSVFTWPDNTRNHYGRISVHPWVSLGGGTRLEAVLYRQRLRTRNINGDAADIEACDEHEGFLCLEEIGGDDDDAGEGEEEQFLTDAAGNGIPDTLGGEGYGVLNRGQTHTRSTGIQAQLIDERVLLGGRNRLAFGFSHDHSATDFATSTELGELTEERGVEGLSPIIVQESGAIAPVGLKARTDHWGLFLADSLPLTSRLTAELALRYNHARIELEDQIGTALNGRHRFERVNPGVELDWAATPGMTLRAGYAETNRAPTPAELSCADEDAPCSLTNFFVADPPLRQVVARNYELGALGDADLSGWRLRWLASAYRADINDDIQYSPSAIRGRAYFRNVGDTRRQGIELSAEARRGALRLAASYAYTDATYRSPLAVSSPAHPQAGEDGTIEVARGDRLPGIPRHSAVLSADYAGTLARGRRFTLGGDVVARSSQYLVGDEANLEKPVPGYALVNLRGSIELVRGLSLFGALTNAFDRKFATFGTFSEVDEIDLEEAPGASNPRAYGPGQPRRWTLGLRAAL
ncbi:MAG: TonB-dependent receptor [Altererythrobacter sp.]|nr:TonB-dependent receptor [Altererythrobacter sp.]